jgi:hypothetical protein
VPAVIALLIGILSGGEGGVPLSPDNPPPPVLDVPVFDAAPRDRPRGHAPPGDYESLGGMPAMATGIVTIERQIIIRIPTLPAPRAEPRRFVPPSADMRRFGPDGPVNRAKATCLPLRSVRGVALDGRAGIMFVTIGDTRYQAALERGCRPVDFQSGFYINPAPDGAICAGRDLIHARSGLRCTITGLVRLPPGM